jgi:hypothetical protein
LLAPVDVDEQFVQVPRPSASGGAAAFGHTPARRFDTTAESSRR